MKRILVDGIVIAKALTKIEGHVARHTALRESGFDVLYCGPITLQPSILNGSTEVPCFVFAIAYRGVLVHYFWEHAKTHAIVRYACSSPFLGESTPALLVPEVTQAPKKNARAEGELIRHCIAQARTLNSMTGYSVINAFESNITRPTMLSGIEYAIRVPSGNEREGRYVVVFVSGRIREVSVTK